MIRIKLSSDDFWTIVLVLLGTPLAVLFGAGIAMYMLGFGEALFGKELMK